MLPHWMHHHEPSSGRGSKMLPVKPIAQNPALLVSPHRPHTMRKYCRTAAGSSPREARTSLSPTKKSKGGRFAFTNKLGGRFFTNNTLTSATMQNDRQQKAECQALNRFHLISESLQEEIAQVELLEKKLRTMRKSQYEARLRKENAACSLIQRRWRLYCILHHRSRRRRKKMALSLQKMLRGRKGRKYASAARDRINAQLLSAVLGGSIFGLDPQAYARYRMESFAKDIQCWWRERLRHFRELQLLYLRSVLLLQRTWRGKVARRRALKLAEIRARKQLLGMGLSAMGRTMYKKRMEM